MSNIINHNFLKLLVKEHFSKDKSVEEFSLLTEIGPQSVGAGSGARPPREFRREISDEELEGFLNTIEAIDYGITALTLITTGGVGTAVYTTAKLGVKQMIKIGLKKLGKKGLEKEIKRTARLLKLKKKYIGNSKIVKNKIRKKIKAFKKNPVKRSFGTAFTGAKYGVTGAAIVYYEDTFKAIDRALDLLGAMQEQKMATLISGNKARVASVINEIEGDGSEIDNFVKGFFTIFNRHQTINSARYQELLQKQGLRQKSSKYKDPRLWVSEEKLYNIVSRVAKIAAESFPGAKYEYFSDRNGAPVKGTLNIQAPNYNEVYKSYMNIYSELKVELSSQLLGALKGLFAEDSLKYMLVSEELASSAAKKYAKNAIDYFQMQLEAYSDLEIDKNIEDIEEKDQDILLRDEDLLDEDGPLDKPFHPIFFTLEMFPIFSFLFDKSGGVPREIVNLLPDDLNTFEFKSETVKQILMINRPTPEEEEQDSQGSGRKEPKYADLDAGTAGKYRPEDEGDVQHYSGAIGTGTKLQHDIAKYKSSGIPSNKGTIGTMLHDNFQAVQVMNVAKLLSIEIFSKKYAPGKDKFFEIFQDFALTILLDPSAKGFGGYKSVKKCREWYDSANFGKFKETFDEVGVGERMLAELIFYYNETYLEMAAAGVLAVAWKTVSAGKLAVPKVVKYGSWQNIALTLAIVIPLAFWDPINKYVDLPALIKDLEDAKAEAKNYAQFQKNKEGEDWSLTDEQSDKIRRLVFYSTAQLEKEINQSISQLFAWGAIAQEKQKADKKLDSSPEGATEECMVYLARKDIREQFDKLIAEIGMALKEVMSDNHRFNINSKNFDDFNAFIDKFITDVKGVFNALKVPDSTLLTGDHALEENNKNYLQLYLEQAMVTGVSPALNPETENDSQAPEFLSLYNNSDSDFYTALKKHIDDKDAYVIYKIMEFMNYMRVENPNGTKSSHSGYVLEKSRGIKKARKPEQIKSSDSLRNMVSNWQEVRQRLRPSRNSANRKYWNPGHDHKYGLHYKRNTVDDNLPNIKFAYPNDPMPNNNCDIIATTGLIGADSFYLQSNVMGTLVSHGGITSLIQFMETQNGPVDPRYFNNDDLGKESRFEEIEDSGIFVNRVIKSNAASGEGEQMQATRPVNGATALQGLNKDGNSKSVHSYCERIIDKVAEVDSILNHNGGPVAVVSAARDKIETSDNIVGNERKVLINVLNSCFQVCELYNTWLLTIKKANQDRSNLNKNIKALKTKNPVAEYETFIKSNTKQFQNNKSLISAKWHQGRSGQLNETLNLMKKHLENIDKLITIDLRIGKLFT